MQWNDQGIVLSVRPHGESATVVQLLTRTQGRHAGLVRGGQGRRLRGVYQPGNLLAAQWRGRLAEHLGSYTCELVESHAARVLDDSDRLAALSAATAVSERALPEREPHAACYEGLLALLEALPGEHWAEVYVRWELALLAELGFGLDLTRCAGGGANDQLAYVSPRTGRAVSLAAGEPYHDRLLPLPGFLVGRGAGGAQEVGQGLSLTGFFLERHVFHPHHKDLPAARRRLAERFPGPDPA
ncbi:MAG TPA: DNA repair protein RecO [Kiloniellales bacterium]|nr:DNA repair protein RecO [Kiloniellales bacterium]